MKNDSVKFAAQVLLSLGLGVVAAILVTYCAAFIFISFGAYKADEWPAIGNAISALAFGLVVGYQFGTINARSRKQKK